MRARTWFGVLLLFAFTLVVVGTPVWLIRPFVSQSAAAVSWAYALRQAAPFVSAAGALLLVAALVTHWRQLRWFGRTTLVTLSVLTIAVAWFARQNHFEWMFRPFPDPRFVAARDAADVPPDDPVIAAAIDGESLAFPIRRIGYHHVVNTTIAREPIVATY